VGRFAERRRVTISEVAARAGVSKTTVSHVLSGNRPVAAATRRRVQRAVRDLGYRPDHVARSLRTQRSAVAALVIPDITNPFFPVLARGLEDVLLASWYRMFICNTDAAPTREREFLADLVGRRVDGIVIASYTLSPGALSIVHGEGIPVVAVGSLVIDDPAVDIVMADDERGGYQAASWLVRRGHTRLGLIHGTPGTGTEREAGFRKALADAGLLFGPAYAVPGYWIRPGGEAAMRRLMALRQRPSAVFCCNDLMALGAMDAAVDLGLSIPEDVAVAGYDDLEWSSLVRPSLTTVANPAYDTGRSAGRLLLDRMSGPDTGARRIAVLPCRLVVRESA
jgi:LacI family transcriptional regulator